MTKGRDLSWGGPPADGEGPRPVAAAAEGQLGPGSGADCALLSGYVSPLKPGPVNFVMMTS